MTARHTWTVRAKPRGTERRREECGRCGYVRVTDSRGRTRYYRPGRHAVSEHAEPCRPALEAPR